MSTVRRTRNQTNLTMTDNDNPSNWTVAELKKKLSEIGINLNMQLSHGVLKRIYLDNVKTVQSQTSPDVQDTQSARAIVTNNNPSDDNRANSQLLRNSLTDSAPVTSTGVAHTATEVFPEPRIPNSQILDSAVLPPSSPHPATVSSMSESVILSTLQLCQQAISSLTQTNRSNENKYSLQTAMTSTNTGIPAASISDVDLVSPEIRADILAGKDVNLNILLIPNYITPAIKKMKEKDERLTRNLSLDEFIVAFGRYKKIMCSAFPNRSNELDSYLAHIIETANVWPERFYEYHQMFSSKCASMLLHHNIKIDWAKGDLNLRTLICAGSSVKSCDACGSNIHSAGMCPHRNSKQHSGHLSSGYKV